MPSKDVLVYSIETTAIALPYLVVSLDRESGAR